MVVSMNALLAFAGCEATIEAPDRVEAAPPVAPGKPAPPVATPPAPGTIDTSLPPVAQPAPEVVPGSGVSPAMPGAPPSPPRYVCDTKTWGAPASVRRLTTAEYTNVIRDVFDLTASQKYPGAYGTAGTGFSTEPGINTIGEQGVEQLLYASEELAAALSPKVSTLLSCAGTGALACATTFLDTYGRRAFRRSLTAAEKTALLAIYSAERADGATFAEGVGVMGAALLQMPAFLYVVEAPAAAGVDRLRTGLELATQLALYLWGSVPDDVLLNVAEAGQLTTRAAVLAQAQRMFADPKADRGFTRFVREWAQVTRLTLSSKDASAFPGLSQALVDSINGSFDRFAAAQLRGAATLRTLLRTHQTYADATLAGFLGIAAPASGWAKVDLDPARYTGMMTQPAAMAALSHSSETSYVFRGRVVRTRLLCDVLGSPPPNAATTFAALPKPPNPTAKELSAAVQSQPACAGCHALLDPAGLALEGFDALGKFRQTYASGKAIDTTGTLAGAGAAPLQFTGPPELFEALAGLDKTADCLARQVFRYTAARLESASDNCALQQLRDALAASGNRLDQLFLASTQTDAFLYRRGE